MALLRWLMCPTFNLVFKETSREFLYQERKTSLGEGCLSERTDQTEWGIWGQKRRVLYPGLATRLFSSFPFQLPLSPYASPFCLAPFPHPSLTSLVCLYRRFCRVSRSIFTYCIGPSLHSSHLLFRHVRAQHVTRASVYSPSSSLRMLLHGRIKSVCACMLDCWSLQ